MANRHDHIDFGIDDVKELFNTRTIEAVIIEIDRENNTADIETDRWGRINGVRIFFHCGGEGTVERGHEAFFEDDPVYVLCRNIRKTPDQTPTADSLEIFAHADRRYPCYGYLVIQVGECFTVWDVYNAEVPDRLVVNPGAGDEVEISLPCDRETLRPWLDNMTKIDTVKDTEIYGYWFIGGVLDNFRRDCNVPFVWTWSHSELIFPYDPPCHVLNCEYQTDPQNFDCEYTWSAESSGSNFDYCPDYGGFAWAYRNGVYEESEGFTHMAPVWGGAWNLRYHSDNPDLINPVLHGCLHQKRMWERTKDGPMHSLSISHEIKTPIGDIALPWDDTAEYIGTDGTMSHVYDGYLCSNVRFDYYGGLRSTRMSEYNQGTGGFNQFTAYEHFHKEEDANDEKFDKVMGVTHFSPILKKSIGDQGTDHPWMNVAQIYLVDTFRISGSVTVPGFSSPNCPLPTSNNHFHEVKILASVENVTSSERFSTFSPFDMTRNPALETAIGDLYSFARGYHMIDSDKLGESSWTPPTYREACEDIQGCVWIEFPEDDLSQYNNEPDCESAGYYWSDQGNDCRLPLVERQCLSVGGEWVLGACRWPGECRLPANKEDCEASGNTWDEDAEICRFNPHNSYLHMNIGFMPNSEHYAENVFSWGLRQARVAEQ